jgi:hypothetical protein
MKETTIGWHRPPIRPQDSHLEELPKLNEKQETMSEMYHLLARYIRGLDGSIYEIAFDALRRSECDKGNATLLKAIAGLAGQFELEAIALLQRHLGMSDGERDAAYEYFLRTHKILQHTHSTSIEDN